VKLKEGGGGGNGGGREVCGGGGPPPPNGGGRKFGLASGPDLQSSQGHSVLGFAKQSSDFAKFWPRCEKLSPVAGRKKEFQGSDSLRRTRVGFKIRARAEFFCTGTARVNAKEPSHGFAPVEFSVLVS
jgi:hypothetical protein